MGRLAVLNWVDFFQFFLVETIGIRVSAPSKVAKGEPQKKEKKLLSLKSAILRYFASIEPLSFVMITSEFFLVKTVETYALTFVSLIFWSLYYKYVQWNYSEDTTKNCKTELHFFTVIWTSILPYIVQCRSVYSSLQLLHCTWSSNQM